MSTEDNKSISSNNDIAKRTQKILKEQGYSVKLSHVFELYSKLSGVKDWNSAKALNKNFKNIIASSQKFFFFGLKKDEDNGSTPNIKNQKEIFNIIFCGGPNTMALIAMRNTLLSALNQDESSLGILFSESRSSQPNGRLKVLSFDFFEKEVELLFNETSRRLTLSEEELEKEPSIFIGIEDLSSFIGAIRYHYSEDRPGSPAFLFKKLLRFTPKTKIHLIIKTDRSLSSDFPSSLRSYFNYNIYFRPAVMSDVDYINIPALDKIKHNEPHRAVTFNEELSFENISEDSVGSLFESLKSTSSSGWEKLHNTSFAIINSANPTSPISVFKLLGLNIQVQENKVYPISFIIKTKDKKIGIFIPSNRSHISKNQVPFLNLAKKHLGLDEIWFYNSDDNYVNGNRLEDSRNDEFKVLFSNFIVLEDIQQTITILSNLNGLSNSEKQELLELLPIKV